MVASELIKCPFCEGYFRVDPEAGAAIHTKPTCVSFDSMDALSFVVAARKILAGPMPWDDEEC